MPSTASPWADWKLRTAASVSGPKMPSTLIPPRAVCRRRTWRPSLPKLRMIECSVVVWGSGAGGTLAAVDWPPLATVAVGPTVSAASVPIEMRLARETGGNEHQRGGPSAGPRAAQGQLPGFRFGEVPTLGAVRAAGQERAQRGTGSATAGAAAPAPGTSFQRALKRCAPVVENSKIPRGSRHARASFLVRFLAPTGLAVGLA